MTGAGDLLQGVAALLWVALALTIFITFRGAIRDRLSSMTKLGLTPAGVSMEFAEEKLQEADADASGNHHLGNAERRAVLKRAERNADLLKGARVVWADDHPRNNRHLIEILRAYGASVDTPTTNQQALQVLKRSRADVILSDVGRDKEGPLAGVELAKEIHRRHGQKTILFTAVTDPSQRRKNDTDAERLRVSRTLQESTAGITKRTNEVLHLVLDQLERNRL